MRTRDELIEATARVVAAIQAHGGRDIEGPEDIDPGDVVGLLADVRHFADADKRFDILELLNISALTYEHERAAPRLG